MRAANRPRGLGSTQPMLVIDPQIGAWADHVVADLPRFVRRGDVVVVNDAATLPASLSLRPRSGVAHELRLRGPVRGRQLTGLLLGPGDWRTDTDARPAPEALPVGASVELGSGVRAVVAAVAGPDGRLVTLRADAEPEQLWREIYGTGRAVQYAYTSQPVPLAAVQTAYAGRPWAAEMPSAGRPLRWETLLAVRGRGATLVGLTHAAGLSATGDAALDRALPLPERYAIPTATARAVQRARRAGGAVIAVGTSALRALEGSALQHGGDVVGGEGCTDVVIRPGDRLTVVTALLSGVHEPQTSHYNVALSLCPEDLCRAAHEHAAARGYLVHEFGDSTLVLPGALARPVPKSPHAHGPRDRSNVLRPAPAHRRAG